MLQQDYEVVVDDYSKAQRLNLYAFDGSPLNPMYLAYKPPEMLPTQTLNPTATGSGAGATSTGKIKRNTQSTDAFGAPLNKNILGRHRESVNADKWWWIGLGMTALGGVGYYCF